MRTTKEIKLELKQVRAEMKLKGVRRVSCFNGGLTSQERHYNGLLFNLTTELMTNEKQATLPSRQVEQTPLS